MLDVRPCLRSARPRPIRTRPTRAGTHTGRPVNGSWPRVAVRAIAPRTPPFDVGLVEVVLDCVVVDVVDGVVVDVVVVDVVPPLGHRLASWLCGPGVEGPSRMSPSCLLCPLFQPLTLIEITTKGFFADPVLWQTSTFWPAVDDECFVGADDCVCTDECVELDTFACECPFAFPWLVTVAPDDTVFCECFCFL